MQIRVLVGPWWSHFPSSLLGAGLGEGLEPVCNSVCGRVWLCQSVPLDSSCSALCTHQAKPTRSFHPAERETSLVALCKNK